MKAGAVSTCPQCHVCRSWLVAGRCDECGYLLCDECGDLHDCTAPACHASLDAAELDNVRPWAGMFEGNVVLGDCPTCHSSVTRRIGGAR